MSPLLGASNRSATPGGAGAASARWCPPGGAGPGAADPLGPPVPGGPGRWARCCREVRVRVRPGADRALAEALRFKYRYGAPTDQFAHPAVAFVLTPEGRISRYLYGFDFPGRDVRLALVEASGGRVGTSFDRVLLKCFRYDPGTGRYRMYAMNFVRGGAFAVFLVLAGGLAVLWRKERIRKRSGA